MKDEYYMNIALREAEIALNAAEVPVGAVLVVNDKIIARGHNMRQKRHDVTKHAEIIAIRNASRKLHDWRLDNATLYVTMSPCIMCSAVIKESRIKKIVIGAMNPDEKIQNIVNQILEVDKKNPSIEIKTKVLEPECVAILQKFFKEKRKK